MRGAGRSSHTCSACGRCPSKATEAPRDACACDGLRTLAVGSRARRIGRHRRGGDDRVCRPVPRAPWGGSRQSHQATHPRRRAAEAAMSDDSRGTSTETARDRIDIFLDGATEPLLSATPPLSFELDSSLIDDGPHVLRVEAYDSRGVKGVRTVDFSVRNGPGIAVSGIRQNDVLEGTIPVIVNAYGGTSAVHWEPSQAETPAPPPTWAWVLLILVIAFGLY